MEEVLDQLMKEVAKVYKEHGTLTDEIISALNFVLPGPLLGALDLIDGQKVSLLTSTSGRKVFQVIGSSGNPYILFDSNEYCSCPAYKFSVLKKGEHKMCKHALAKRLSVAMETCPNQVISDAELTSLLTNMA